MSTPTLELQKALGVNPHNFHAGDDTVMRFVNEAGEHAYRSLTEQGLPYDQVHRMTVCAEASELMLRHLLKMGVDARRETHSPDFSDNPQNYVVINRPVGSDWIADPTWQLYVDPSKLTPDTPRVLVGPRPLVLDIAKNYGIDERTRSVWQAHTNRLSPEAQRDADRAAYEAAEEAEDNGAWDRFASQDSGKRKVRRFSRKYKI